MYNQIVAYKGKNHLAFIKKILVKKNNNLRPSTIVVNCKMWGVWPVSALANSADVSAVKKGNFTYFHTNQWRKKKDLPNCCGIHYSLFCQFLSKHQISNSCFSFLHLFEKFTKFSFTTVKKSSEFTKIEVCLIRQKIKFAYLNS